jgi:hypothetical protein
MTGYSQFLKNYIPAAFAAGIFPLLCNGNAFVCMNCGEAKMVVLFFL